MSSKEKGMFLPTTSVWDTSTISSTGLSDDLKQLFIRLYRNINDIAMQVNKKDSAVYGKQEFVCGQTFFPNPSLTSSSSTTPKPRQVYRKVIYFSALGSSSTVQQAHGLTITSGFTFTRIYGCASDTTAKLYLPIPYSSVGALGSGIEVWVDATNVNIKVGTARTSYSAYVIVEYLKH